MSKKRVAVLGAGSFGTALSKLLHENGHDVLLWGRDRTVLSAMKEHRMNIRYLPDVPLPSIAVSDDLEKALYGRDLVVFAVPSQAMRSVVSAAKTYIPDHALLVHTAKGLERESGMRMSEVMRDVLPPSFFNRVSALSGPSHAEEVARGLPTTVVVASDEEKVSREVQSIFFAPSFRVYINQDLLGVELSGSLKNIIALGAGISDGLGFGDNAKAALLTRGLAEIARLGVKLGAHPLTFLGLAGMGDLIVTATSRHSRNWRTGKMLGEGMRLDAALATIGMVVEGVKTTEAAYRMSRHHEVEMPITTALYAVLFEGLSAEEAVPMLMGRERTDEGHALLLDIWERNRQEER
ncbi:MAG: Glycerol-3-phosphate dehydrogenase [NAD(P)+] [Candidatus Carbobacillus altaicus]|uniref:Glycerol-3-phosphate dehydrogenase [NAD(P)+] n=1 Tax=Candidatus Carbonibacillus altaicus TaxID=2163959 RepID=A0A2R6Y1N5_9BACL|nr:MAG: Glycerol-3-phosphate dehydrogenase [NAD(P)+] [Candidatus Carbobacillus altaicus]